MSRSEFYDYAFRWRWSDCYSVQSYISNFIKSESIAFEFPSINSDKSISVVLKSKGSVTIFKNLSIQAATLYSTPDGVRKVRVFNLYLPLEKNYSNIYKNIDQFALSHILVKESLSNLGTKSFRLIREYFIQMIVKMLSLFKSNEVKDPIPNQIYIPESCSSLLFYSFGILKSRIFRKTGNINYDWIYATALKTLGSHIQYLLLASCPLIYKISDIMTTQEYYGYADNETGKIIKPSIWDNSVENLGPQDLCIIDDAEYIYLYIGSKLDETIIYDIFGCEGFEQLLQWENQSLDIQMETDAYYRVVNIIEQLRYDNAGSYQPIVVVCEGTQKYGQLKLNVCIESYFELYHDITYQQFVTHLNSFIK